mmetsp:Transcript_116923/g.184936  ORF Transcript_116923/g.184936 Transcript_116923/m.184936 type:complete len:124 (-) Transcript_116923:35-406(-)
MGTFMMASLSSVRYPTDLAIGIAMSHGAEWPDMYLLLFVNDDPLRFLLLSHVFDQHVATQGCMAFIIFLFSKCVEEITPSVSEDMLCISSARCFKRDRARDDCGIAPDCVCTVFKGNRFGLEL